MLEIKLELAKETYEAADEAAGFIDDVRRAAADGLDWADAPALAVSAMSRLMTAIKGIGKLPKEFSGKQPSLAVLAIAVPLVPAVFRAVGLDR